MKNETTSNEQKILAQELQARNTRKQTQPKNDSDARRRKAVKHIEKWKAFIAHNQLYRSFE